MTRQPVMVGLDIRCEIAANNTAKSRLQLMFDQYGPELINTISNEMIGYTESILRERIAEISDGSWSETGTIQLEDASPKIALTLHKKADHLLFDFTGSDRQVRVGINLPYHATFGSCFEGVLSKMGYDLPKNQGAFYPIEVIAPEGTVVNVQPPGPVSLNTTSGGAMARFVVTSTLTQMLATSETWRNEVMALNRGRRTVRHAGVNQYGKGYVSTLAEIEGGGARCHADGIDSGDGGGGGRGKRNVEWIEQNFPLLYLFSRHLKDGGGAGKFRGGVGVEVAVTPHDAPEGELKCVAAGVAGLRNSGQGIFGGYPGAPSLLILLEGSRVSDVMASHQSPVNLADLGGQARLLPYCDFDFHKNDVLHIIIQNGGGYGDPLDREPQLVLNDVINGLVSKEAAHDIYGVVLDELNCKLDLAATEKLRTLLWEERRGARE